MTKPGRNDPCPCGSGKKYKHCHLGKPDDAWIASAPPAASPSLESSPVSPASIVPDMAPLDNDLVNDLYDAPAVYTPLDEAWDIVDDAMESDDPKERARLARQALKISPDCAGAHFLLGQFAETPERSIQHYEGAIAAARRVLAPRTLEQLAPHQWLEPEVDFAMYAMLHRGLAEIASNREEVAVATLRSLLDLDPSDRVRARLQLVLLLIAMDDIEQADLVERQENEPLADPTMAFARALLKFIRDGDSVFARRALADAIIEHPAHIELLASGLAEGDVPEDEREEPSDEEFDRLVAEGLTNALAGTEHESDMIEDAMGDPITQVADMFAVLTHSLLWQNTEGADAWIESVRAAGPRIRYDNKMFGDGPLLTLPDTKQIGYLHCPECHRKTEFRPLDVVVQVEPNEIRTVHVNARHCGRCDIVAIELHDLSKAIDRIHADAAVLDFMPLGFIPEEAARERDVDAIDAAWAIENMSPWRGIEAPDSDLTEWPTMASKLKEMDDLLQQLGSRHLFGPVQPDRLPPA